MITFELQHFFITELKGSAAFFINDLLESVGGGDLVQLQKDILNGELTEAQIQQLHKEIRDQVSTVLGPVGNVIDAVDVDIPFLRDLENALGDLVLGDKAEDIRQAFVEFELNTETFEQICELP